jgi:hypothetical protein
MLEDTGFDQEQHPAPMHAQRRFWTTTMLPLRITRAASQRQQATKSPRPTLALDAPPPPFLRPLRLLSGMLLLALAWGGVLLVLTLAQPLANGFPRHHLTLHVLLSLLSVLGACWIGVATLACIVAGAFCLMLALTSRGWQ